MNINRTISVSGGSLSGKFQVNVIVDFSGIDEETVLNWAMDQRMIALQRVLRAAGDDYVKSLNGKLELHASACGGKILTSAERVNALVRAGMPQTVAELAISDPTKFAKMMANFVK